MLLFKHRVTDSLIIFISLILDVYDLKKLLLKTAIGLIVLAFVCIGFLFMAQTHERGPGNIRQVIRQRPSKFLTVTCFLIYIFGIPPTMTGQLNS